jgi:hypothetical protein
VNPGPVEYMEVQGRPVGLWVLAAFCVLVPGIFLAVVLMNPNVSVIQRVIAVVICALNWHAAFHLVRLRASAVPAMSAVAVAALASTGYRVWQGDSSGLGFVLITVWGAIYTLRLRQRGILV